MTRAVSGKARVLSAPSTMRLADAAADEVRRSQEQRIRELQTRPGASMRIVSGIVLADGVATPISHGLGRAPIWIRESNVRGAAVALSSTSTSVAANTLTDTKLALTPGSYAGRLLRDAGNTYYFVVGNSATAISLQAAGATPAAGAYTVTGPPGSIVELRSSTYDRSAVVVLLASGWGLGLSITLDLAVM